MVSLSRPSLVGCFDVAADWLTDSLGIATYEKDLPASIEHSQEEATGKRLISFHGDVLKS